MNRLIWTAEMVDEFIYEAMLDEFDTRVLKGIIGKETRVQMAMDNNVSVSTIDRAIARIWRKYEAAAEYNPLLPRLKRGM